MQTETFVYQCPTCRAERNAAHVAAELSEEILVVETARRNARHQTPHAGPGRPVLARCPGCDAEMSTADLRDHRIPCVRACLKKLERRQVLLSPKDLDPYPTFMINSVGEDEVVFEKLSSGHHLNIELRKIAEITFTSQDKTGYIRVLGQVIWDGKSWCFVPSRIGRPMSSQR